MPLIINLLVLAFGVAVVGLSVWAVVLIWRRVAQELDRL